MRGRTALPRDAGAAAVEFALVSVLLFTILFGIVQYGIGLWQVQAAQATTQDAARQVIAGIDSCGDLTTVVSDAAGRNGLDAGNVVSVALTYVDVNGAVSVPPALDDFASLSITYRLMDFNLPFVPFPNTLTRTATSPLSATGGFTGACP
jgi:Flp pilus assembly protein TadG